MKAFDYYAVVFENEVYCISCLPEGVLETDYEPIFADSEWQNPPVCNNCGEIHSYVQMLPFIPQQLVKVKNKKKNEYILNSNGIIELDSKKLAHLYWEDGELKLRIFSQVRKEKFKKTSESEEITVTLNRIEDAIQYLGG